MRNAVSTLLLTLLLALSASAATFDRVTDRDLLDRADVIVVATVLESSSRELADRDIVTDSRLQIEEVLKGSVASGTVTVTQLGGFANGRGIVVPGSANYVPGERVLAFLRQNPDGSYYTAFMGFAASVLRSSTTAVTCS
jgi:hypothetical protein